MESDDKLSMRVLGRKGGPKVDVVAIDGMQKLANTLRKGRAALPKGVFRFKSFEEADAWLLEMMTRR